ncbi:MAG TPA: hypothetical protein VF533_09835 [Solirubrobacteraceae bacterium]|jgi:hypothetical protein
MPVDVKRRAVVALVGLASLACAASARAATAPQLAVQPDGTADIGWLEGLPTIAERSWRADGSLTEAQAVPSARAQVVDFDMAADAAGGSLFVWRRAGAKRIVEARRRAADGSLGPILQISSPLYDASAPAHVAVDPDGDAAIVWQRAGSPTAYVQARRLSARGSLGPIQTLSPSGYIAKQPEVAMDPAGTALAVWVRRGESAGSQVVQSRRIAADGTLGTIQSLSTSAAAADDPQVAFDASGIAIVVWLRYDGSRFVAQLRRRLADGTLGAIVPLTSGGNSAGQIRLAVDPAGDAMVAFTRTTVIQARHRKADGTLGSLLTLSTSDPGSYAGAPQVAIDDADNALVGWTLNFTESVGSHVQSRRRSAGGVVGGIETVAARRDDQHLAPDRSGLQLAMAPGGTATFAWDEYDSEQADAGDEIVARRRRPDGSFGTAIEVSRP